MDVIKTTISLPSETTWKPTETKSDDSKLNHLYHLIQRVYKDVKQNAPNQSNGIDKYDMVARNLNEALLLLAYREKQSERIDKYAKKLKKAVKDI